MCLDASIELMEDGTDGQITLEVLEGLFHRDELQIEVPQLRGIGFREIGAEEVARAKRRWTYRPMSKGRRRMKNSLTKLRGYKLNNHHG